MKILGYLWALPCAILGLLIALPCIPRRFAWHDGALDVHVRHCFPAWASAQTWGWVILVAKDSPRIARHERVHVKQYLVLGPLFLVAYPLASVWAWMRGGNPYRDNWFERQAYGR